MRTSDITGTVRGFNFSRLSEDFLSVNRAAYICVRQWQDYSKKASDPKFHDLARISLRDAIKYLDRSVHALAALKRGADSALGVLRRASANDVEIRGDISDALRYYVMAEKSWQRLTDLADAIERSGVSGQEDVIRGDIRRHADSVSVNLKTAIDILVNARSKAVKEWNAG